MGLEKCSRCKEEHSETDDIDNADSRGLIWVVVWALWAQPVGIGSSWKRPLIAHRLAWDRPVLLVVDPLSAGGCSCLSADHPLRLSVDLLQMQAGLSGHHFHLYVIKRWLAAREFQPNPDVDIDICRTRPCRVKNALYLTYLDFALAVDRRLGSIGWCRNAVHARRHPSTVACKPLVSRLLSITSVY